MATMVRSNSSVFYYYYYYLHAKLRFLHRLPVEVCEETLCRRFSRRLFTTLHRSNENDTYTFAMNERTIIIIMIIIPLIGFSMSAFPSNKILYAGNKFGFESHDVTFKKKRKKISSQRIKLLFICILLSCWMTYLFRWNIIIINDMFQVQHMYCLCAPHVVHISNLHENQINRLNANALIFRDTFSIMLHVKVLSPRTLEINCNDCLSICTDMYRYKIINNSATNIAHVRRTFCARKQN